MTSALRLVVLVAVMLVPTVGRGAEPLHKVIDAAVLAKASGKAASPLTDDGEFLRRVYLDLAGRIPSIQETKAFLQDKVGDKRAKVIDQLLASPEYPRRMQELFNVIFMERLGDNPEWTKYLRTSFEVNKPWDQMVREILNGRSESDANKGAAFFYSKRLENYGQNAVDYPALTRDVGRLFLGMDLQCAQCHDHRFIKEYKQHDFQGLFAFFQNVSLADAKAPAVGEKLMTKKLDFQSVFNKQPKTTGPRIPGGAEIDVPTMKKGEEFAVPPDPKKKFPGVPKFSPLAKLSEQLPVADNKAFVKNSVNRLWFVMLGRGIVHPLDLHHADNPPSHPELLDALAAEFVAHKFDIKFLLREIALSQTYQRSSVLPSVAGKPSEKIVPELFLVATEKRVTAEQLLWSVLEATGVKSATPAADVTALQAKFVKAFANPAREPEDEFTPSLKAALFVLNDDAVLGLLTPKSGNLIERLAKLPDDQVADELYLSVLTRPAGTDEKAEVVKYLTKNASRKPVALGHLAWALLASTEFCVNH